LPPCLTYFLLCDAMFWGLTTRSFQSTSAFFTRGFLPCFLANFVPFFLCLKGLICAMNYPCPISQLRVIRHNRTKCRDNGTIKQNYFLSIMPMQITTHLSNPRWGPTPLPPPSHKSQGPTVDIFYVDGRHSRISVSTHQGPRHQRFLALMVAAPGYSALTPPRGPTVDVS
jgi:hypothetical protein